MAVYIVTGNLGGGKSLVCMGKMREYLWARKRVATNVNVRVEHLVSGKFHRDILRIPDHPTAEFLWDGLGFGGPSRDEAQFGMLLIDEVGTWLNAREWKGSDRQKVIEWFIHSRKRRWDCFLVAQSSNMIDKQVREAIGEHIVFCRRFDRMGIPMIGPIISMLGSSLRMPQLHVAAVRYVAGMSINSAPTVDRWFFSARDLWGSYDTAQRFHSSGASESGCNHLGQSWLVHPGCASMLSPDAYKWLCKPKTLSFSLWEFLSKHNFAKLAALVDSLRTPNMSDMETDYRYLQIVDQVDGALVKRGFPTFSDWLATWGTTELLDANTVDRLATQAINDPSWPLTDGFPAVHADVGPAY